MCVITGKRIPYKRNGIWYYKGREILTCPVCGSRLYSHGTCRRKVTMEGYTETHHLRVLKCRKCNRTHRELPDTIIPYKHYGRKLIGAIVAGEAKRGYEESTRYRLMQWFRALLFLVVSSLEGQKRELCYVMYKKIRKGNAIKSDEISEWLKLCVEKLNWNGNLALVL